jgi:phosphoribosylformylglycinamidine synthase
MPTALAGQAKTGSNDGQFAMAIPKVLVLRAPGSNCDQETQFAFELAGARVDRLHINRLRETPRLLQQYQILCIPGGFTFGDDVGAGKILALSLTQYLGDALRQFRAADKLILGICNGFQVLLKAGLLMPADEDGPVATLTANTHGRFEARWVQLTATPGKCPFLRDLEKLYLPIAHGEGRFLTRQEWILQGLEQTGQVVLRYADNPNGSMGNVAGLCDFSGNVFGLMPHPERHVQPTQHPQWPRRGLADHGDGLAVFRNAVEHFVNQG